MTTLFLTLHVLAAIVAVGPVTVAASMFPPAWRRALRAPEDPEARSALGTLHRICRVYATVGIAVPVFGFATASGLGVLGSAWLIASVLLTAAAAALLALVILPAQAGALAALNAPPAPDAPPAPAAPPTPAAPSAPAVPSAAPAPTGAARLAMPTGVFNLLWATVTVLMIIRPGSTTGV
ncbi:hypothetical protein [Streptomyces sp. NPDC127092]|uniref:hypothetical protein n=1 Tax=Streptomyces sp. NPDC127092 TaxID=3347135 RepID=UPI0036594AB7